MTNKKSQPSSSRKIVESLLTICAMIALLTFSIIQRKKVGNEDFKFQPKPVENAEQSNLEEKVCPEFQPEYNYGKVSFYDNSYCEKHNPSCLTASGEVFDEICFTAACDYDYRLGTSLRFYYKEKSVVVRCNDRGDFKKYGRVADLSKKAFEELASTRKGELEISFEVVRPEYEAFNQYRENQGLSKLARSEALELTALLKAQAIDDGELPFDHGDYSASISAYYKNWETVAENLASGFSDFDNVLSAWHKSKGHKKNLQLEDICDVGIGKEGEIWVLHLGRRDAEK